MKFRIYKINFKNGKEYEDIVNALYEEGEVIDETLKKFEPVLGVKQHIVRLNTI